ncbi:aldehyde dehydrogenase (NADP(+)) [Paenibacillus elgii]
MITGKHYIGGEWVDGSGTFVNQPTVGEPDVFSSGTVELVNRAAALAQAAFGAYASLSRNERGIFLEAIAEEIEALGESLIEMAMKETALPHSRLTGERGRTVNQLRLFASHIRQGDYLDRRRDEALPERNPARPDLRLMQVPVGPVAVFGASNFPLAFSVAGGDTAAALAAGCPVVVKGHSSHPGTSELVAQAIDAAVKKCGIHKGVFSLIQGGNRAVGTSLVQHPGIKAVGFTGSKAGGRALFDLCAQREEPIPFFGELGSVNPMFVLQGAAASRAEQIGKDWVRSLTLGAGQFCTNPGVIVICENEDAKTFLDNAVSEAKNIAAQTMLNTSISEAYCVNSRAVAECPGVTQLFGTLESTQRMATPGLFVTTSEVWRNNRLLQEEVFGPLGLIVLVKDNEDLLQFSAELHGQLTCTLHMEPSDFEFCNKLVPILTNKAGRLIVNEYPTGVEVCDSMVHSGPYPASTNFGATSVGTMSIRRFLRPVCFQNFPVGVLPNDLAVLQ